MSSRPRPTSQIPRAPAQLDPDSVVDGKAVLNGNHTISIGPSAVIHPYARILSVFGPVSIGPGSVVSERTYTGHVEPPDADTLPSLDVVLGANVIIEPGAHVAALEIGDCSVIGMGARIGAGAVLGKHCRIAAKCVVRPGEMLPDYTVVYADGRARRQHRAGLEKLRETAHERQLEALRRLIKSDLAKHNTPL